MIDPLNAPTPTLSLISTKRVPNVLPSEASTYRLAIVGEAPGEDEENYGMPFVGISGRFLDSILGGSGVDRAVCMVANVCQYRPPGNEIKAFDFEPEKGRFGNDKVKDGWTQLKNDLAAFAPNAILALGNTPLYFLCGKTGITSWRGSILQTPYGKCVPSIHPAAVLREYKQWPLLRFDTMRARSEAETSSFSVPQRILELNLSAREICNRLDNWPAGQLLSFDIEGGLDAFPCCSVAGASNSGFIIAWSRHSQTDQAGIAVSLSRALYSSDIPKVLQNSLYDRFVLAYGYRMLIRNVVEDTMLKQWEIYPELPKGLGTIASIWTREPAYKFERKTDDPETFYRYCIKDSCVTLEACLAQDNALSNEARRHYQDNVSLLSPLLYMELRGIRYDSITANSELAQVRGALSETATRLELRAGYSLLGAKGSISSTKLKRCLYAEKGYPEQKSGRGPTAKVTTDVEALLKLSKKNPNDPFLSDILLHRKLESILETLEVSTDSDGRVRCGYNLVGTETGRLTCYTSPTGSGANLQTITKKLRKLYIADDGYWLFQCDLSGADGWTVAAHCLQHGDPTMWDDYHAGLKPAKIIALMYMVMEAQVSGIPAAVQYKINDPRIAAALFKLEVAGIDRLDHQELALACSAVDGDGWLYFACKRVQHGSNYGMQGITMQKQIMTDSYKMTGSPVYLDVKTCESLQRLYLVRYPGIYQWHNWAKRQVFDGHDLQSASGHTRRFFGRRKSWDHKTRQLAADHETWKEFLADEPQENTSYANNLALQNLWEDVQNRTIRDETCTGRGSRSRHSRTLIIEPLHTVHDALIGQFPKEHTAWAIGKIRSYFSNELCIAGSRLTIPFEGSYGPSWGQLGEKYGGGKI